MPYTYGQIVAKLGLPGHETVVEALLTTMESEGLGHVAAQLRDHLDQPNSGLLVHFNTADPVSIEQRAVEEALHQMAEEYRAKQDRDLD